VVVTAPRLKYVGMARAGMISHHHLLAWSRIPEYAQVIAICDPDISQARSRATEFGIPNIYPSAKAMLHTQLLDAALSK
jgi:D-apiose dehydrogenase